MDVSKTKKSFTHLSFICEEATIPDGFEKMFNINQCWKIDLITEYNEAVTLYILYSCLTKDNDLQYYLYLFNKGLFLCNVNNVKVFVTLNETTMDKITINLNKSLYSKQNIFCSNNLSEWLSTTFLDSISMKKTFSVTLLYEENFDNSIVKNVRKLFLSEEFSDLKLITKDHIFKVHKNLMATRSEVFNKMLNNESNTNEIKLLEWDFRVVGEFLRYLYTSDCNIIDFAPELFELAHYLQIKDLQVLCLNLLRLNINESNILKVFHLIDKNIYELYDLRRITDMFFKKNESNLIEKQEFIEYFFDSINKNNVAYVLQLGYTYKKNQLLLKATDFIINNEDVVELDSCKTLLTNYPDLLLEIFKYSLKEKKKNHIEKISDEAKGKRL